MKYYRLKKDLPTFKAGDLFALNDEGSLWHNTVGKHSDVMAYHRRTIEAFPNILKDWFEEVPEPTRDQKTKEAFVNYMYKHKDERFFQAVRNFTKIYLKESANFICSSNEFSSFEDTFHWECDTMLKEEE